MVWQDTVMMIINTVFAVSLLPQIWHGFKEKKGYIKHATSIPTFLGIYTGAFCLYTLSLYYSAIASTIAGTCWLILFVQRIIYPKA